jgi:hypothetical protein
MGAESTKRRGMGEFSAPVRPIELHPVMPDSHAVKFIL